MFLKMKISSLNFNKNLLFKNKILSKNFSVINVMKEANLNKSDILSLSRQIKSKWVKPGSEKIVNKFLKNSNSFFYRLEVGI